MSQLKLYKGNKSNLDSLTKSEGTFIICEDLGEIYLDKSNSQRVQITDIINLDTEADRTGIIAPLNKFYYVKATKKFYYYNGGWTTLDADTLDGKHASDFALRGHNHDSDYYTKHVIDNTCIKTSTILMPTNPFRTNDIKTLYINNINNALYAADRRFIVTGTIYNSDDTVYQSNINCVGLFNGSYEGGTHVPLGKKLVINIIFNGQPWNGYPYGTVFLSFYHIFTPKSAKLRVYQDTYNGQPKGWTEYDFTVYAGKLNGSCVMSADNSIYAIKQMEITVVAPDTDSPNVSGQTYTALTEIDFWTTRPYTLDSPLLSNLSDYIPVYKLMRFYGRTADGTDSEVKASIDPISGDATFNNITGTVSNANISNKLYVSDTRGSKSTPSEVIANGRAEQWEFKNQSDIGLNSTQTGFSFVYLKTICGWVNNTGGYPIRIAYCQNGKIYRQVGTNDTTWGDWKDITPNSLPASDITGVLPVANGGTGQSTAPDALNSLITSLPASQVAPMGNDYFVAQVYNGGTTDNTYQRKSIYSLYNYIKGKTDTLYSPKTHSHTGSEITFSPPTGMSSATVQSAIEEVFQSASSLKSAIATAVTGKGVATSANDSSSIICSNIQSIGSQADATASSILSGKTAYVGNGYIIGTILSEYKKSLSVPIGTTKGTHIDVSPFYLSGGGMDIIFDTSNIDPTAIKSGVSIAGTAGTMPNYNNVSKTLDTVDNYYEIPAGYHTGNGVVGLMVDNTKTVTPTTSTQMVNANSGTVIGKVTVNPIPSNFVEDGYKTFTVTIGSTTYNYTNAAVGFNPEYCILLENNDRLLCGSKNYAQKLASGGINTGKTGCLTTTGINWTFGSTTYPTHGGTLIIFGK